ncbi:ESX secretion-associated protein EspG [Gordonia amicalis]|uniref:ESX secretion-associated protein EspG n=1 Tax=Gordonia amicalis TaxID=89053 RepID=UPI0002A65782|nr:ESX secretion-associated protein EspG [Gordonia amicalis]MBA5848790.1 ESX secretion-associated protein EspG [Gordonia amicalis]MCZ0914366.1 ESX secretion-associated protein EspG [Gordonia amicalis]MDV7175206.1 ESX secretion-associated protein EspG [Gordonia amicalis]NKX76568.1 ESX secretion-associated protein EspG [Gordonia amicalis]UOG22887.1 ESX secretion-associated protein EspG [Gordonia amicalis]
MMPTTHDDPVALDAAVLLRLGDRFGVQTWPVVLDMPVSAEDESAQRVADRERDAAIAALGLVDHDEPVPWLATVLRVLSQPQREIEIRSFTDTGVRRMCLARRGYEHVLAERAGEWLDLAVVEVADLDAVADIVRSRFDDAAACEFTSFSVPTDELVDSLGRSGTGTEVTDALYTLGVPLSDAVVISSAFASCRVRTEIVASSNEDGRFSQSSGALAVFDTARGRIVSSPSKSPDGRVWTTLSPGSGHRIAQAVRLLIETLPDGTWST